MARSYRKYTDEERAEAVRLAVKHGVRAAAIRLGFPHSSVSRWADLARAESAAPLGEEGDTEGSRKRVARRYTPSEKAQALEYAAAHGVSAASRDLGMTRMVIYAWKRKQGRGEIVTTGPDPASEEEKRDREILDEWAKHTGLGPSQIKNQLRRRGIKVSTNTVRRVMEDAGYRTPKVRRHEHAERYEAVRPNHLWHFDFVHRHVHRASTFSLILLDDHSRFVTGFGVDDAERGGLVIETFENAVARYGRPEMVMTDRGSAFWSWRGIGKFTKLLEEMGIDQIAVRDKESNGKLEVFNKNLEKELFDVHRFNDVSDMIRRLQNHLHWYNHHRTHHALGGLLTPADRYYGRVDEVMALIEGGIGKDALDDLDLRHRTLDLFRVTSSNGKPEIWLMGRKLFTLT